MHPDIIDRRDPSLASRKLREQSAAREMEKHYTKQQILEAYLNQINLGRGWFGVEAGARHYFGKHAAQAHARRGGDARRAAEVAAAVRSDRASGRREGAAQSDSSEDGGAGLHHAGARRQGEARSRGHVAPNAGMSAQSGYFVDAVQSQAERAGIPVMNGGYRIYTTLDPALQRQAVDRDRRRHEQDRGGQKGYKHLTQAAAKGAQSDYLQAMAVAIDPFTGDVRALVGGRNYARAPFNRAITSLRQPGSSIKPIVYAKAIEDSIPANAIIPDTALAISQVHRRGLQAGRDRRKVLGTDDLGRRQATNGAMTMREGLMHSRNMVAIQLGHARRDGFGRRALAAARHQHADGSGAGERDRRVGGASRSSSSRRTPRSPTTGRWCSRGSSRASMICTAARSSHDRRRRRSRCSIRASRSSCAT